MSTDTELLRKLVEAAENVLLVYHADGCNDSECEYCAMKAALSRLLEAGVPEGWQPIETAPKDATAILVMRDIWPGTKSGHAEECCGHNTYVAQWWSEENNGDGAWICYMGVPCEPECPIEPTHWMPLPHPPSEGEQGGEK